MNYWFYLSIFCAPVLLTVPAGCSHGGQAPAPYRLTGVWHAVSAEDTLGSLASHYGCKIGDVSTLNDVSGDEALTKRREIFIPTRSGERPGTGAPPPTAIAARASSTSDRSATPPRHCGTDGRPCLRWPVKGRVSSVFGKRSKGHHDGIDILAPSGTPILAAAGGTVLYSGDEIKGYGNLVILRHNDGIITVYAHNEKNLVAEGDKILARHPIAKVGKTGSASTAHLHFEIRVKERPRDPLGYLPSQK